MRSVLSLCCSYRQGNWGTERLGNSSQSPQLAEVEETRIWTQLPGARAQGFSTGLTASRAPGRCQRGLPNKMKDAARCGLPPMEIKRKGHLTASGKLPQKASDMNLLRHSIPCGIRDILKISCYFSEILMYLGVLYFSFVKSGSPAASWGWDYQADPSWADAHFWALSDLTAQRWRLNSLHPSGQGARPRPPQAVPPTPHPGAQLAPKQPRHLWRLPLTAAWRGQDLTISFVQAGGGRTLPTVWNTRESPGFGVVMRTSPCKEKEQGWGKG